MATLTLEQILATPLGKTPVIDELQSLVTHVITNRDDIGGISGGGEPGFNAGIDTRWSIQETAGVANTYVAAILNAAGNVLYEGAVIWMYGQLTNTGNATLNADSSNGNVPIKKAAGATFGELAVGDMPTTGALLYYSLSEGIWILMNPVSSSRGHFIVTTTPTNAALYNNNDLIYVVET
ncbi:MAG: hypothetical protein DRH76_10155 [Deltaproteobacteria bacterium]|nr:MAG: hypothetical protein DRH76_10155 [Deltaproteobacteria bacterium]